MTMSLCYRASKVSHGSPGHGGDTVYFCAVDCHGNACSFTNSTYDAFGSGLVPKNCGFTLQVGLLMLELTTIMRCVK